nr:MAG TPA: hypothetical protein [Caudoviricetes sp.]
MIRHYQAIRNGFTLCLNIQSFAPHAVPRLILVKGSVLPAERQLLRSLPICRPTPQVLLYLGILLRCRLWVLKQYLIREIRKFLIRRMFKIGNIVNLHSVLYLYPQIRLRIRKNLFLSF